MPEYLIDQAVVIEAFDPDDARRISDEIRRLLSRHRIVYRIRGVRVCHIEEAPPSDNGKEAA